MSAALPGNVSRERLALRTRLRPGAEEEYEDAHRHVPEELIAALKEYGATSWTIWRSGLDLFHVVECSDFSELQAKLDELPVNQVWQARMEGLLEAVDEKAAKGTTSGLPVVWEL
jgi:L-rhamnose mutarotase